MDPQRDFPDIGFQATRARALPVEIANQRMQQFGQGDVRIGREADLLLYRTVTAGDTKTKAADEKRTRTSTRLSRRTTLLTALSSIALSVMPAHAARMTLSGTVSYRERIALPAGSWRVLTIRG